MRGDVWVEKNSKGDVVVCIDNGKRVVKKVIKDNSDVVAGCNKQWYLTRGLDTGGNNSWKQKEK